MKNLYRLILIVSRLTERKRSLRNYFNDSIIVNIKCTALLVTASATILKKYNRICVFHEAMIEYL